MALEDLTGTKYIDDLNSSNPAAGDNVSEGDDHIRGIKNVLKTTFPSIDGAITATDTELNYVDGVTSNVQTQLDAKLPLAGGTMTGKLTMNHDISMLDNKKVTLGTSDDLQIYHDGSNSYIADVGTGDLTIRAGNDLRLQDSNTQAYLTGNEGGSVEIYHNNVKKLETTAAGATVTGTLTADLADDSIDSEHYVDGSIDAQHIASDAVTQAKIADEAVDEARLQISNAGTNGYFLQKQSGNTGGLTWAEVPEGEDYIPNGSVMAFFQASAPTGWTQVTTQNDKTLRVVSGTGGGTGGDWAMSAGETTSSHGGHVHSSAAHTHGGGSLAAGAASLSEAQMPSHRHEQGSGGSGSIQWAHNSPGGNPRYSQPSGSDGSRYVNYKGSGSSHQHSLSGTSASTTPGDTGSAGSHTHTIAAPQYIDVIICSKDA